MSLSISGVLSSNVNHDAAPAPKQPVKPTEAQQVEQLASQGHSAQSIASLVGLPEALVAAELGTTTTTTSSSSQATAVLALGARLSVQA